MTKGMLMTALFCASLFPARCLGESAVLYDMIAAMPAPPTGDETSLLFWLVVFLLCGAALLVLSRRPHVSQ